MSVGMKERVNQFMCVKEDGTDRQTDKHTHTSRGERRSVCEGIGSPAGIRMPDARVTL